MTKTIHGRIRGKTIELDEDVDIADGEEVEVIVKIAKPRRPWGEGIKRSAGALANSWTEEDDRILDEIQEDRKRPTHREIPE
jgi:predicted DNA-binding antitoxin AbrB/MazE fold protein